jgi:hypothetical protein
MAPSDAAHLLADVVGVPKGEAAFMGEAPLEAVDNSNFNCI